MDFKGKTYSNAGTHYHCHDICPRCGNGHDIKTTDSIEGTICEAETSCTKCGYFGFWQYGFFDLGQGESKK